MKLQALSTSRKPSYLLFKKASPSNPFPKNLSFKTPPTQPSQKQSLKLQSYLKFPMYLFTLYPFLKLFLALVLFKKRLSSIFLAEKLILGLSRLTQPCQNTSKAHHPENNNTCFLTSEDQQISISSFFNKAPCGFDSPPKLLPLSKKIPLLP